MLHSIFFLFLFNLSSLLNKLTKFHLIFSDDYEKKIHPFDSTPICVFVAYSMYPAFLLRPSIYILKILQPNKKNFQIKESDIFLYFCSK